MESKICRKCNIEKPLSEFYKNRKNYRLDCKQCYNKKNKKSSVVVNREKKEKREKKSIPKKSVPVYIKQYGRLMHYMSDEELVKYWNSRSKEREPTGHRHRPESFAQ